MADKPKLLILDRDGTLIVEPQDNYQIDSLEKLEFLPGVFQYLSRIVQECDYELLMVTNQDGLGTASFPEADFWPAHEKMLQAFANEGIHFKDVLIDRSFPEEGLPTRKPGTGLLTPYMQGAYDLANSIVVGDRYTDVELAKNLGAKGIYLNSDDAIARQGLGAHLALQCGTWAEIYRFLRYAPRTVAHQRKTKETDIALRLCLDGRGEADIRTGLGFFDHMLEQLARHGGLDLELRCSGDLHIDEHHTIEDTALALGEAFAKALADKRGLARYGFCLPMDDALAQVAVDFGGRPWLVWSAAFRREKIGDMPTEMFFHFFKSFADAARCNLNIKAEGDNEHHQIEAIFKAFAKAIRMALRREAGDNSLPSTKGLL